MPLNSPVAVGIGTNGPENDGILMSVGTRFPSAVDVTFPFNLVCSFNPDIPLCWWNCDLFVCSVRSEWCEASINDPTLSFSFFLSASYALNIQRQTQLKWFLYYTTRSHSFARFDFTTANQLTVIVGALFRALSLASTHTTALLSFSSVYFQLLHSANQPVLTKSARTQLRTHNR